MIKNGAVIFFSGTGNTRYIARLFKERFKNEGVNIDLIDIQKYEKLEKEYDLYIIGTPIHVDMPVKILVDWIKENIPEGNSKCIVYHTLANDNYISNKTGLAKIMKNKGYNVVINEYIGMPNNYYHTFFKSESDEVIKEKLESAPSRVSKIVNDFYSENRAEIEYKKDSVAIKLVYDGFLLYSKKYPKRNFSVDASKCINCKICEDECPTKNISMDNKKITFFNKCIGCEKCIHRCPTNAILYKNKPFKTYKIEKYLKK